MGTMRSQKMMRIDSVQNKVSATNYLLKGDSYGFALQFTTMLRRESHGWS